MPTQRETLLALRERVLAATGADRQLDRDIYIGLRDWSAFDAPPSRDVHKKMLAYKGGRLVVALWPEPITWSFDAANALVEQQLPRWKLGTAAPDPTRCASIDQAWAKVEPYHTNDEGWKAGAFDSRAATVPLSICAAVLTAKAALASQESANVE